MGLSLLRFRKIFGDTSDLMALDDRRVRARQKACAKTAALLDQERERLRRLERYEREARRGCIRLVAGVDEVGRGPLAGPLVAAAVVFEKQPWIPLLDDSKKLTEEEREALFDLVHARALAVGLGVIEVDELNVSNLHHASLLAMRRALDALAVPPDFVLVDGCHVVPSLPWGQKALVKGDSLSLSIAAASVVAKVTRDRTMRELDARWPGYGFAQNKGYGTAEHLDALARLGPCPLHRRQFAPVARFEDRQLTLFD